MPPGTAVVATTVPVWRTSRPESAIASSRPAVTGGIRWRWTSQLRAWSARKRRLSSSSSPCQSWAVTGRSPSIAGAPVAGLVDGAADVGVARRGAARRACAMRVMPGGGGTAGVVGTRCTSGTRSCRETVCSVRPGRSAAIATSTMVRPVPTSSRSPSGSSLGPRVGDEAVGVGQPGGRPVGARAGAGGEDDGAGDDRLRRRRGGPRTGRRGGRSRPRTRGGARGGRCRGTPTRSAAGPRRSRRTPGAGTKSCGWVSGSWWVRTQRKKCSGSRGKALIPLAGTLSRWRSSLGGVRRAAARASDGVDQRHAVARGQAVSRWEAVSAPAAPAPTTTTQQSPSPPRMAASKVE